jgi:DNA-binding transcriptional LysR family regulator
MIDRYLLRYFLAVVDCGTFSKAALQVNVAQPTLSIGIAKLERLLNAKLFHRSNQRIHLTDAGTRFAVHARRIEREFNLAEASVLELDPIIIIRLGVLTTIPTSELAAFVSLTREGNADTHLEIIEDSERNLLQHLARGRVDVALTLIRPDSHRFAGEVLRTEGYSLALPSSHPLAGEDCIPAEAIGDNVMIVRRQCELLSETSRHFTERGIRPFFALRTMNDDRALAMVKAGLGITVMPDSYRLEGVVRPRLAGFNPRREIGLLWATHANVLQHSRLPLIEALRQQFS